MASKTKTGPSTTKAAPASKGGPASKAAPVTKAPTGQQQEQKMKLTYFDLRGRCEHIRYLLAVGKLSFDDVRVNSEEWQKLKPDTPTKSLPMLEFEGKKYGQSVAVARLVARKAKLYGTTLGEQALVDEVVDTVTDVRETVIGLYSSKEEEKVKEEKTNEFYEKKLPGILDAVADRLGKNQYFLGKSISWADIHFYAVFELVGDTGHKDALSKHAMLQKLYTLVESHPQIAEWRKKRPQSQF